MQRAVGWAGLGGAAGGLLGTKTLARVAAAGAWICSISPSLHHRGGVLLL